MNTDHRASPGHSVAETSPADHAAALPTPIRNRIKSHRQVRAGDLVPHEWNFRLHLADQRAALDAIYREVGFARSLLTFELPDGRLKLIDGHLRRDLDPDMPVDVEVLDVTEEEARRLLLTIDPLAALAQTQQEIHTRLRDITPVSDPDLQALWQDKAQKLLAPHARVDLLDVADRYQMAIRGWLKQRGLQLRVEAGVTPLDGVAQSLCPSWILVRRVHDVPLGGR